MLKRSLLALSVAAIVSVGCKKKEDAADAAPAPAPAPAAAPAAEAPAPAGAPAAAPAVAKAFDIATVPVSAAPLGEWPYLLLPAGYRYGTENRAGQIKDLARVPFWTGGQLLWVEGKTFEDQIFAADGKTFSQFELLKGIEEALTALGAVRISDKGLDPPTYEANKTALQPFLSEFDDIDEAYYADEPTRTYVIRRADKVIWVTLLLRNERAIVLVAEAPPAPSAQ